MKRLVKIMISLLFLPLAAARKKTSFVFLTYHNVSEGQAERFRRQMEFLLKNALPCRADVEHPSDAKKRHVAVTFDDGFSGVLLNALPILEEMRVPAAVFFTTGYLGRRPGWITDGSHPNASVQIMSENQIAGLAPDRVLVGSHCVNHPRLSTLPAVDLRGELLESKAELERITGRPVTMLSLPHGDHDEEVLRQAEKAGFKRVFLNIPGKSSAMDNDAVIGRIDISPDDWPIEYKLKILGCYGWTAAASGLKRSLRGVGAQGFRSTKQRR